ncbi:MAG TPA: tetratricopeptide repeat protein [Ferruginibacter sp.]|nr:tetratricopeptide repeat protein [Ferruginibacter sp.]
MSRIDQLKEFLEKDKQDSFLQHALALEYIKIGDDAAAKALFEQVLDREPGYVGSYYHLAKLLERQGSNEDAIVVYEKGMKEAKKAGDNHAYNELQMALEELTD